MRCPACVPSVCYLQPTTPIPFRGVHIGAVSRGTRPRTAANVVTVKVNGIEDRPCRMSSAPREKQPRPRADWPPSSLFHSKSAATESNTTGLTAGIANPASPAEKQGQDVDHHPRSNRFGSVNQQQGFIGDDGGEARSTSASISSAAASGGVIGSRVSEKVGNADAASTARMLLASMTSEVAELLRKGEGGCEEFASDEEMAASDVRDVPHSDNERIQSGIHSSGEEPDQQQQDPFGSDLASEFDLPSRRLQQHQQEHGLRNAQTNTTTPAQQQFELGEGQMGPGLKHRPQPGQSERNELGGP